MNDTKKRIKETALRLFLQKGYSVGINEIIEQANTSKGAFYHHFKRKGELFIDTIDDFFFKNYRQFDEIVQNPDLTLNEKMRMLIYAVFEPFQRISETISREETLNYINILAEYPNNEDLKKKSIGYFERLIEVFRDIFNNAQKERQISQDIDVDLLSYHIGILIDGAVIDAILVFESISESLDLCNKSVDQILSLIETK